MIQLQGETVVRNFLAQKINEAENELISDIQGIEREFFTLVLGLIEGAIPLVNYPRDIQDYLLSIKYDLVQVLDSLLRRGVLETIPLTPPRHIPSVIGSVSIGTIHPNNFQRIFDILMNRFEPLSNAKTLLFQCEISNHYSIEVDDNNNALFDSESFRRARSTWLNQSIENPDWESYFFGNPENSLDNFRNEISANLERKYGFRLSHLNFIGRLLDELYVDGNPATAHVISTVQFDYFGRFVTISREALREGLHAEFPNFSTLDVGNFLDSLIYQGGDKPTRTPFFRIGTRNPPTYFVWTSVPAFRASWISEVTSGGDLGTRYGNAFEEYVRSRIHDNTGLSVHPTSLTISRTRYSDITESFNRRERMQIDALACDDTRAYIISCKAHDLLFDQENMARLRVSPYSDFYSRILRNYDEVMEVCQWVDILQSSQEFYDEYNLGQRELVPVLITPRPDPLQYTEVRSWFASVNPSRDIPNCEVLSIADFETQFAVN